MPHYHPNPRTGGHIFYEIAALGTFSHYTQCDDKQKPCVSAVLGEVADFFNPLSAPADVLDLLGYGK